MVQASAQAYRSDGEEKGNWAHDRECVQFVCKTQTHTARMTTQPHLSSQTKVTTCFVLNDCSDESETPADIAGQNVLLPTDSTGQTLLTQIASTASTAADTRTGSFLDVRALDNGDEPWLSETDDKSGWNTRFNGGTYRGMLHAVVLRDYAGRTCLMSVCSYVLQ